MHYKLKFKTLVSGEEVGIEDTCLGIDISAVTGQSVFTLNDGDPVIVRDGKSISLVQTQQLDSTLIKCVSGQIDVLITHTD